MSTSVITSKSRSRASLSRAEWLGILAVLLLAAGLRFAALEQVPPALNVDEAVNGYEAYSLLKTGRDEWGNAWPLTIRAFNDYRRPAMVYSAIPFVAVLGLTLFAVRAAAATWGLLTVLLTYCLARDMFGRQAAILAGLMLALSSWHLSFSRQCREATVAIFSITLGLWCVWRWFSSRRQGWLVGAGLAFGLSFYTYNITLAFTPLMLGACGLIFGSELWRQRRTAALTLLTVVLVAAPLFYALLSNPHTGNRLDYVTVFRPGEPLRHALSTVARQWWGHFSPDYLFIHGDAHKVLHPPGSGQLYVVEALLLPLGVLGVVLTRRKRRAGALLLAWVALGAVPAALTTQDVGTAHSLRGMLGLPAFAILAAQGALAIWEARRIRPRLRVLLLAVLAVVLAWNAVTVLRRYFVDYPVQYARAYEYGIREAMDYVTAHEDEYDTIVLTDWISQPHIFALFFQRYDPRRFQAGPVEYTHTLSAKVTRWDKYRVGNVDELYGQLEHGLFVARPHMLPGVAPVLVIHHPDGSPAFKVIPK
jgi:4-amino-4-deoxy-L-arabinose transferase-like glycosyltransferase